ncbi:hypothetical protein FA15DRAFT_722304 [Coprinopsis marcescibilis]|uniref:Uncharacterized protein n=1 Tax=Coprinopsis marcescibilis TaxID=230819 RepID=A0A5C3KJI0_COPMA|nr:hypothetical protein FA15DRAFT_722304 [Coprinopsis marcescibilis]
MPPELVGELTSTQFQHKIYYLVSFYLERQLMDQSGLGVYVGLFIAALNIMLRKRNRHLVSARVFLGGAIAMFVVISFHNWLNIYRMTHAYAYEKSLVYPVLYLRDNDNWDAFAFPVILALVIWIADLLVIYRCWLIWQKSYRVVALPMFLLVASVAIHSVNLSWFRNPNRDEIPVNSGYMLHTFRATFPLQFVQNLLTTGLISWRLWIQHRRSQRAGVMFTGGVSLLTIVRIVVESALIYTLEMLVMMVLFFIGHPAQIIFQHALVPTTGLVFLLIAIRVHSAREGVNRDEPDSLSIIPSWIRGGGGGEAATVHRLGHGNMPMITTVTEEHRLEEFPPGTTINTRRSRYTTADSISDVDVGGNDVKVAGMAV